MLYSVVSRLDHGGYRCEQEAMDLSAAIWLTRQRAQQTQRRHYVVDRQGRLVEIVHPH
ncbi:MAG: hypothetical protein RLZZ124_1680 [Cyanobacteriota bacterium]